MNFVEQIKRGITDVYEWLKRKLINKKSDVVEIENVNYIEEEQKQSDGLTSKESQFVKETGFDMLTPSDAKEYVEEYKNEKNKHVDSLTSEELEEEMEMYVSLYELPINVVKFMNKLLDKIKIQEYELKNFEEKTKINMLTDIEKYIDEHIITRIMADLGYKVDDYYASKETDYIMVRYEFTGIYTPELKKLFGKTYPSVPDDLEIEIKIFANYSKQVAETVILNAFKNVQNPPDFTKLSGDVW